MRATINIKGSTPADIKRQIGALYRKLDTDEMTPGADFAKGNVRIQVAVPQENDVRAWARKNGYSIGARGRVSAEIQAAYDKAHEAPKPARKRRTAAKGKASTKELTAA